MRIVALETVRIDEHPNILWILLHTDDGLVGLGETFTLPRAVEAYLHDWAAPRVIGKDPSCIEAIGRSLRPYLGGRSAGAETRGNSAVNIALWDLKAQALGISVADLLGGRVRDRVRVYNTCAGPGYMRRAIGQTSANWGEGADRYDDLHAFRTDAGALARELLAEGITAMKIWPFDPAAERNDGLHLSAAELAEALRPFEQIRDAVGDAIDIMVEFHSLWRLTPALRIARALAPFGTYWHEDPIRMESLADLSRYAAVSPAPVCASETLGGVSGFRDLLETGAAGVVMPDLSWCGGLSEAHRIAVLADAWQLPVAPHDCTGPVVLCASTHLCLAAPNALIQETVRAYHRGWYREVVDAVPPIEGGFITAPPGSGLGMRLHPELDQRFTVHRTITDGAAL